MDYYLSTPASSTTPNSRSLVMTTSRASFRPHPPRAVIFAEYSELVHIPRSEEYDRSLTWYSSLDRNSFRQTLLQEARKVSNEIEDLRPGEAMSHEQVCNCLGIELFLRGIGAARHTEQARCAHITAVLSEQRRQKQTGVSDMERLSSVSMSGSEWATTRARKLAACDAAVLIE
jgi:hypothetical protein